MFHALRVTDPSRATVWTNRECTTRLVSGETSWSRSGPYPSDTGLCMYSKVPDAGDRPRNF